ncbi:hypothetical protein E2R51_08030 [Jeotgalibacillus sp. S-D1]|uniref:hypothetical protein n=1 Tax=Jeotgalibacillus sp. S-D1 TaxID=2552189 RepID=UPI001059BD1B|nr:hypothetical protein [Jeotgalibacillus sp. S-D1]TDL32624.1 hypothetical protein E2R51_08030 [Jeotgalibacillus sp. S-D1]
MIRKILIVLCFLVCASIIFIGNRIWVASQEDMLRQKPKEIHPADQSSTESTNAAADEQKTDLEKNLEQLPVKTIEMWVENQESEKPVDITFVASASALSSDENWTTIVEDELSSIYSETTLNFSVISNDGTSEEWFKAFEEGSFELDDEDIVLYELPTLMDNGVLSSEDQVFYTSSFLEDFTSLYPEASMFVLPSQPLYDSTFYPQQVEAVREAAEEYDITYVNHWTDWPSMDDEDLKNYLTEENDPNELGHMTWGTYLVNYFSAN